MHRRQPLPRLWLMTDERQGKALWDALERLPRGSGVVFRHYALSPAKRMRMLAKVSRIVRRRGLVLTVAGKPISSRIGYHGPRQFSGLHSGSAHNVRELRMLERMGADVAFVSPVFATRSHPDARTLGRVRFNLLSRQSRIPVIALGGMNARKMRGLKAYGWGGIDAWSDQKRKAVPR